MNATPPPGLGRRLCRLRERSAPVEVLPADPPGGHPAEPQPVLEAAQHGLRTAHEDRQPARVAAGDGKNVLGREAAVASRVDEVGAKRWVASGDRADLVGERWCAGRGVEEVDAAWQMTVEVAQPAEERRDADASGDPHLAI